MDSAFILDRPCCTVRIRRNTRARQLTLRLAPDGGAVATAPPGVPVAEIHAFVVRNRGWLEGALGRIPPTVPVGHATTIPIDGAPVTVRHDPAARRGARLVDGTLHVGGRGEPGPRVAAWLKLHARAVLVPAAEAQAARLGRRIARVSLRDTTSRWGSCSSRGALSFSWRLAMAPPPVQAYVALHEAAHLVQMNHSSRFWALVARHMPDYEQHRDWLRREGRGLHAYRFGAGTDG